MKVYKLTNKYRSVGPGFYGGGMAIIIANSEKECIEVMNNYWYDSSITVKNWDKKNTKITELPLTYTGAQTEPFVLTEEWYND